MRKILVTLGLCGGLTLGGLGLWNNDSAAQKAERHPLIRRALVRLREARKDLEKAPHKFDGHRADAIKDIDRAIRQLEKCLTYR